MGCKKIRQANGGWVQLELYIRHHSRADFSHGLCPECDKMYSSLEKRTEPVP
jgi:hypothetical protein